MGVMRGTFNFLLFRVDGDLPSGWLAKFEPSISMRRFVPLRPMGDDTESCGFVPPQSPFNDDEPLTAANFIYSDQIYLTYREDSIKIPQAMLKDRVAAKVKEQEEKTGTYVGSKTKSMIHAAVIAELRAKILPKSTLVEFVYDVPARKLRFFGRGKAVLERFVTLFEQTFELKLVQMTFEERTVSAELPAGLQNSLSMLHNKDIFARKERLEIN